MADKDIRKRKLESYNDVFADIINTLYYEGKQVMKPEELSDSMVKEIYDDKEGK